VNDVHLNRATIKEAFAQIYKLFNSYQSLLLSIIENNPIDSPLVNHFIRYFTQIIYTSIKSNLNLKAIQTPTELVAQHCSSTILEVLKWIYLGQHKVSLEEAENYLSELLSGPIYLEDNPE